MEVTGTYRMLLGIHQSTMQRNLHSARPLAHAGARVVVHQQPMPVDGLTERRRLRCRCKNVADSAMAAVQDSDTAQPSRSGNGSAVQTAPPSAINKHLSTVAPDHTASVLEFDSLLEKELQDGDFRSTRRTKIVCTIGPACCSYDALEQMAASGMNVARLNMCHGTHEWHENVIDRIRQLNQENGYCIAIMVDTEGSEIHTREIATEGLKVEQGDDIIFTVRNPPPETINGVPALGVSYDSFIEDVEVGDSIVVDGGMVALEVIDKAGPDVLARTVDPGLLLSRANLTFRRDGELVRGRNSMLPVITAKDWMDIDFAIRKGVDLLAVSFVKNADVIKNLRSYIETRAPGRSIELVAKIESYDCIPHIEEIIAAADGVMVARGDLGAQVPVEEVPSVQKFVVVRARQLGKPSIVASHLLQSMIEYPIPTRAEVADVADVVRQRADALMLCGETAMGRYPMKCVGVLRSVALRMEGWVRTEHHVSVRLPVIGTGIDARVSEEICASAVSIANHLEAKAIFVFTRRGYMASFLSRQRPDCPIFAFTDDAEVRQRLNLRWGVTPFRVEFSANFEDNVRRTFRMLQSRGFVKSADVVVVVSDLRPSESDIVRSVQVRRV